MPEPKVAAGTPTEGAIARNVLSIPHRALTSSQRATTRPRTGCRPTRR